MLTDVTGCIGIRIRMIADSANHQVEVTIRSGEERALKAMSRWLTTMNRNMIDGIHNTMHDMRREGMRMTVMEGDMGPRIISYLGDDDLPQMARTSFYYAEECTRRATPTRGSHIRRGKGYRDV